jgi:hypothetical protein
MEVAIITEKTVSSALLKREQDIGNVSSMA